jgi:hypothetical protein
MPNPAHVAGFFYAHEMPMQRLMLKPTAAGYAAQIGGSVLMQQLDGGQPRFERDILGASHSVSLGWTTTAAGYQYLLSFYRVWLRNPSEPFIARLILDDHAMRDYQCQFMPNSLSLSSKSGPVYNVSAQITAKALASDDELDDAILMLWEAGAQDGELPALEKLANVDLPDALDTLL